MVQCLDTMLAPFVDGCSGSKAHSQMGRWGGPVIAVALAAPLSQDFRGYPLTHVMDSADLPQKAIVAMRGLGLPGMATCLGNVGMDVVRRFVAVDLMTTACRTRKLARMDSGERNVSR